MLESIYEGAILSPNLIYGVLVYKQLQNYRGVTSKFRFPAKIYYVMKGMNETSWIDEVSAELM